MILNDAITLANGLTMPRLGLGTWLMTPDEATQAVKEAIGIGYRLIDTAQAYANEEGVGKGIASSGIAREELFITTKIAAEVKSYQEAASSLDRSLALMHLSYLDLLLIHSPQPWVEVNQSEDRHFAGNREVWRAMEDAVKEGKVRSIGVSNFLVPDLENILSSCQIAPQVNQILSHPGSTPFTLIEYCVKHGIQPEAYSPIAHGAILSDALMLEIARDHGVSTAQVCLRYALDLGLVAIPKTTNPLHMATNAELDFTLSARDLTRLKAMTPPSYGAASAFPVYGGRLA